MCSSVGRSSYWIHSNIHIRSKDRGDVWGQVAIIFNSSDHPKFKVRKLSVRDRLTLLQSRYKEKMKREEMA